MRRLAVLVVALFVVLVAVAACGGGHHRGTSPTPTPAPAAHVRVELKRVGVAAFAPPGMSPFAAGPAWSSAVTFGTLKVPVMAIALESGTNGGSGAPIYACAGGTPDACLVDLASGSPLADLLSSGNAAVTPGTFDHVTVATCSSQGHYSAHVAASLAMGGQTWFTTTAGSGLSTTGPAVPVTLSYHGCARAYPLATPITLTTASTITLELFFETRDLAWGANGDLQTASGWFPSGCTSTSGTAGQFFCASYPDIAATLDPAAPTIEHYDINGQATFSFFFDSTGAYYGGVTRYHHVDGVARAGAAVAAGVPITVFRSNGGGTFTISEGGFFTASDFKRLAVSATSSGTFTDYQGSPFSYKETRSN